MPTAGATAVAGPRRGRDRSRLTGLPPWLLVLLAGQLLCVAVLHGLWQGQAALWLFGIFRYTVPLEPWMPLAVSLWLLRFLPAQARHAGIATNISTQAGWRPGQPRRVGQSGNLSPTPGYLAAIGALQRDSDAVLLLARADTDAATWQDADTTLAALGLRRRPEACQREQAWLGRERHGFLLCPVQP